MKAVIFAGGEGIRMRPLSKKINKQMLRVHGIPMLEHVVNILPKQIKEVFFLASSDKGGMMKKHFGKKFKGKKITFLFDKDLKGLRGTWMPLQPMKRYLKKGEKFLLLCGDDMYSKKSLNQLVATPTEAVLGFIHQNPERFGVLHRDAKNFLTDLEEKPEKAKSNLVSTGAYVLSRDFLEQKNPEKINNEYRLTDVVKEYLKTKKIKIVKTDTWLSITTPEDYILAHDSIIFDY